MSKDKQLSTVDRELKALIQRDMDYDRAIAQRDMRSRHEERVARQGARFNADLRRDRWSALKELKASFAS